MSLKKMLDCSGFNLVAQFVDLQNVQTGQAFDELA
jgi:hypothetical protein